MLGGVLCRVRDAWLPPRQPVPLRSLGRVPNLRDDVFLVFAFVYLCVVVSFVVFVVCCLFICRNDVFLPARMPWRSRSQDLSHLEALSRDLKPLNSPMFYIYIYIYIYIAKFGGCKRQDSPS